MAVPISGELGVRALVSFRAEKGGFGFRGLNLQKDPGSLKPGEFQDAVNVRFKGGRACSRGGLEAFGIAVSGEIIGLFDDREDYVAP